MTENLETDEFDDDIDDLDDPAGSDEEITSIWEFFEVNKDVDGFWDALREDSLMQPDHEWWEEDEDDGFDTGFKLGVESVKSGKPLTSLTWEATNIFYWLGTEEEVLRRLQEGWAAWQEEHPQVSLKDQRRKQLQAERDATSWKIAALQRQLKDIESELE